jgi:hypothetical protein
MSLPSQHRLTYLAIDNVELNRSQLQVPRRHWSHLTPQLVEPLLGNLAPVPRPITTKRLAQHQ